MSRWPYPGDSPLARARRTAQAYREHLHTARPDLCAQLDQMFESYGEGWVCPDTRVIHDLDDWLTPAEAAAELGISTPGIRALRNRGRLAGVETDAGWRYRYRDVLAVASAPRTRGS